ncbi:MAG: undecaprenyl-diphosphate phosphatase, partial [Candidatus Paceibacterales bacterium]
VIIPKLLSWNTNQNSNYFLIFLVATHLATAIVLLSFFWRDWVRIISGLLRSLKAREIRSSDPDAKLAWLLIVSTIPAGVIGLLFEENLKTFFASAQYASFFLALNGVLLFAAERLKKRSVRVENGDSDKNISKISWAKALIVGSMQSLALIPGFSRTGSAIAGGLLVGLSHEDSARFSFLLATPVIGAAAALKIPELVGSGNTAAIEVSLIGALFSATAAYFSVRYLTRYFKTQTLKPFAIYCFVAGLSLFLYFLIRR